MKNKLDRNLPRKYPNIFKAEQGPGARVRLCFPFECDDGWYALLDDLCSILSVISKASGVRIRATQVKEKFGSLRFYTTLDGAYVKKDQKAWFSIIEDVINHAEDRSSSACEVCGAYGKLCSSKTGWLKTLCKKHFKERGYLENKSK